MSSSDLPNEKRRRQWVFIVLALLLICGCVTAVWLGKPLIENILSGDETTTPLLTEEVTRPPADEPTETVTSTDEPTQEPTDEPTEVLTEEPTEDVTEVPVGRGACLDPCSPTSSNCLAGLTCVSSIEDSTQYICWNQTICGVSVPACDNNGICDPGEGADCPDCQQTACVCGDSICEQARCNELIQTCPADCDPCVSNPSACDPCAGNFCGDGVCRCGENYSNCGTWGGGDCSY